MRLMKAAAYALLGYVLYELFLGIADEASSGRPDRKEKASSAASGERASRGSQGRGPERHGRAVETKDADGSSTRHIVGRGVVGS
ncbi:MAG: hypothetical protein M3O30_11800 [Planctomycetota bacterium]|nr:hypothetical protein [Planctomycetota bacterium]